MIDIPKPSHEPDAPPRYEFTQMPSLEEIKAELEGRYDVHFHGTTFRDSPWDAGTHVLTQWSPIYIEVRWGARVIKGGEGYYLSIAKNDHTKEHMYITPWISTGKKDTLDKVIAEIGVWCKKAKPKQMRLFE